MNQDLKDGRKWAIYLGKSGLKKENSRCKSRMFGGDIANRRDQKDLCAMQLLNVS